MHGPCIDSQSTMWEVQILTNPYEFKGEYLEPEEGVSGNLFLKRNIF